MKKLLAVALLLAAPLSAQTRIASDFEIARMRAQLAQSRDFLSQLSAHLNLGDAYASRSETATASSEYSEALGIATRERVAARRDSDMTRYATATSYAALTQAKLGAAAAAFGLAEESIRYTSSSAKSWNLYASAMSVLRRPAKAASAARNAVAIATREESADPSVANRLDRAIYEYALASALVETGDTAEAEELLRDVVRRLDASAFDTLKQRIEQDEAFEIYSTARGESSAYLSLRNRASLRLGALLESRGDRTGARQQFERVLANRSDDPTALAAMARLTSGAERQRFFAAAFDANPFSRNLIAEYRKYLRQNQPLPEETTTGGKVRRIVEMIEGGELRAARTAIDALQLPANETLAALRLETEVRAAMPELAHEQISADALRQLLRAADGLDAAQRAALDVRTFESIVRFDSGTTSSQQSVFQSGRIEDVPFRFTEPTAFFGAFQAATPLRLRYRILGVTEANGKSALLLEPLGLTP